MACCLSNIAVCPRTPSNDPRRCFSLQKQQKVLTIVWLFLIMMTQGFLSQTMNANSNGNKAAMSPDRDSLVALDALLRIRESRALDSASSQNAFQARTEGSSTPRLPSIAVAPAPLQPLPEWAARLGSLLPLTTASYLLNGHHQHAVMAPSPAQIHMAAVQVATKNWGNNLLASHAPSPSSSKVVSPLRTPHASAPTVQLESKPEETSRRKNESLERAEAIRKEKVAEALRSKPQRGRKRDELNDDERLELTRTRNREHAKSTRYGAYRNVLLLVDRALATRILTLLRFFTGFERRRDIKNCLIAKSCTLTCTRKNFAKLRGSSVCRTSFQFARLCFLKRRNASRRTNSLVRQLRPLEGALNHLVRAKTISRASSPT